MYACGDPHTDCYEIDIIFRKMVNLQKYLQIENTLAICLFAKMLVGLI